MKKGHLLSSLIGICSAFSLAACSQGAQPPTIFSFDMLDADLAKRVKDKMLGPNSDSNTDIIVGITGSADPIGTIYRDGTAIAMDRSACTDLNPSIVDAFYFPSSYRLTREAAVQLGLDNALKKIAELGINLKNDQGITLEFSQNKQIEVDDNQINNAISLNKVCKATIGDKQVFIVRGYVAAKRNFTASAGNNFDINIKAEKIGTLTIKPVASSGTVEIVDEKPANFLQIIQVVKGSLTSVPIGFGLMPFSLGTEKAESKLIAQDSSLSYIQIDATDSSNNAFQLEKELRAAKIRIADDIEKIQSSQMPGVTQVRYFNATDKSKAEEILQIVRKIKPDAVSIRFGLPAPIGQTEIWLTR